jgi:hypothetical protein
MVLSDQQLHVEFPIRPGTAQLFDSSAVWILYTRVEEPDPEPPEPYHFDPAKTGTEAVS